MSIGHDDIDSGKVTINEKRDECGLPRIENMDILVTTKISDNNTDQDLQGHHKSGHVYTVKQESERGGEREVKVMKLLKMCMKQDEIVSHTKEEERFIIIVGTIVKVLPTVSLVIALISLLLTLRGQ